MHIWFGMSSLRNFRFSLLPIIGLSLLAISSALTVACSHSNSEDQGLTEDRITSGHDYGYGEYGYGYGD